MSHRGCREGFRRPSASRCDLTDDVGGLMMTHALRSWPQTPPPSDRRARQTAGPSTWSVYKTNSHS